MMKCKFVIEVPLSDTDDWFTLCECETPEYAADVVLSLLRLGAVKPLSVKIVKVAFLES